ncbi:RING/FYVE/PHD zinc finger superfamily protein [Striga asiatica]|uniref:RING/FYVE/PHD zinc finger superfamily protein n=1 Tax=Striga asiatica TaxID=4170 RepID=A0A5A7RJA6_STRAF|nr:RING/FYVE/PHD zinc finger superfamily protein [Striga asiatica]
MSHSEAQFGSRAPAPPAAGCGGGETEEDGSICLQDVETGGASENKVNFGKLEGDCRICHLSLFSSSPSCSGPAIQLGCACKDDLAAAHKHCADTWFKIRGNKTCEICNSVAENVVGPTDDFDFAQEASESSINEDESGQSNAGVRRCLNGHRLLNILLSCLVFAFAISWLLHFGIPS